MTEPPKPSQPFNIDLTKLMPQIAQYYVQFGWIAGMMGLKVPPEVDTALRSIATGKPPSPEEMQLIKNQVETMQPAIGEPVLGHDIALDAWEMHYKNDKSYREIAEILTKEGYPCSHATVQRYCTLIDMERQTSKILKLVKVAKALTYIVPPLIAFWIGTRFF